MPPWPQSIPAPLGGERERCSARFGEPLTASPLLLRSRQPSDPFQAFRGKGCAEHTRPNLCKRGLPSRGSIVAKRGETAIVGRAKLIEGNGVGRFENPVANDF